MCLHCGYYNGRQVMDLVAEKAKRDARIKEKKERIKVEAGSVAPVTTDTEEKVDTKDESKKAKEKNTTDRKPKEKSE